MKISFFIAAVRRAGCTVVASTLLLGVVVARAGDAPAFAVPGAQSATTPVVGTLRVTLAMILVLGAVLAAAWLTRRMRGAGVGSNTGIQVLAQVSLGARERAVLLRIGGRQVLVGVAPGNVRALHVLDSAASDVPEIGAPASATAPDTDRPTFKSMLLKSLGK